jgi:site-specific DNA recombinase
MQHLDMTVRCAIYLRISLDSTGEQLAVQRQRDACQLIAEHRGWQVIGEYVDNSISASDKRKVRPGYDQLVAAFHAGEFDALVCWDLDRLTRQPRQLEDWIDAADERGLLLVTANGEADLSTDGGRLFARIKASVARSEVERKSARQRAAALQRSERGKPPMGVRLTGYTVAGETIAHEAAIVKQIFDRFATGDSLRSLAAWLTGADVPTRHGRPWNPSSVRSILVNPRYDGQAIYQGQKTGTKGNWASIVDENTFALVQSVLADPRRKTQHGTDRKHLGSGLFDCDVCAVKVRGWSGNRYRCPHGCLTRSQAPIDRYVLDVIRARLSRPDVADLVAPMESDQAKQATIEVQNLRARLTRIEDDYDRGDIDGARYKVSTQKVQAQLATAQGVHARLSTGRSAAAVLLAPDPVAAFDAAPLMIQRSALDELCTVSLLQAPRGRKAFDTESVVVEWKKQ